MGEVATTMLLFTASVAVAAGLAGVLGVVVQDVAHSGEQRGRDLAGQLRTAVRIINDPTDVPQGPVRFYIKNTGSEALAPNLTTLLVDGVARTAATFAVLNASQAGWWRPGEVVEATDTTLTLAAGDHAVAVIVDRGVRDSLKVRV